MAIAHHQPAAATAPAADDWLAALNAQQRQAVLHGTGEGAVPGPLLVIAGAGSGKTDTLAHRVAHLVRQRRRPAAHPAADVLAPRRGARWSSAPGASCPRARHRAGARRRRRCPGPAPSTASARACCASTRARIGLDPAFTIHDRGDAEDLMALVRHELGFATTRKRFPLKATCLAIYSRVVNSEAPLAAVLRTAFPVVRRLGARAEGAVRRLRRGQAGAARARLRRPAALLGAG